MSQHIEAAFQSHDYPRYSSHMTSTVTPHSHTRHQGADGSTKILPSTQAVAFNSHKSFQDVTAENVVSGAFQGSEVYNDWILPNQLHVLDGAYLEWTVSWTSDAAADTIVSKPAWQQISHVTYMFESGNDTEQLRGTEQHLLWTNATSPEDYSRDSASYGMDPANRAQVLAWGAATGNSQVFTRTYRIRLGGFLQNPLFVSGIADDQCRIRVTWASSQTTSKVGAPVGPTMTGARLICEETQLDTGNYNRLMAQYRSANGVHFRYCELRNSVHPFTVTANQQVDVTMTSHSGLVAGLMIFIRSQSQVGTGPTTFLSLTSLQLKNERNLKVTEVRSDEQLKSVIYRCCDFPSGNGAQQVSSYFVPLNSSLYASLSAGIFSGGYKCSGRDLLSVVCSNDMQNANGGAIQVEICSINWNYLHISNGRVRVEKS